MTAPMIKLELGVDPSRAGEFICEVCSTRRDRNGVCSDLVAEGLRFAICCECAASGPRKTAHHLRERVRYLKSRTTKLERLTKVLGKTKPGPLATLFQAIAALEPGAKKK